MLLNRCIDHVVRSDMSISGITLIGLGLDAWQLA